MVLALLGTCDTCCQTGGVSSCRTAFHNQPGQCCGFHDNVGQCCPYGAQCVRCPTDREYRCAWPGERIVCRGHMYDVWDLCTIFLAGILLSILFLSCCHRYYIQSQPANVITVDGTTVPAPQVAVPVTNATLVQGGTGSGNTAFAVGTGLLGGMLLSDVLDAGYDDCRDAGGDVGFLPDE